MAASAPRRALARRIARAAADEQRYALALESINHGVYDWDIVKAPIYYSPLLRADFRHADDDQTLTPEESASRIHPDDLEQYRTAIVDHLKGDTPRFVVEYRYLDQRQHVALGAPERHRAARSRRHRDPHDRRDHRHHRGEAARAGACRGARRDRDDAREHAHRAGEHERRHRADRQGLRWKFGNEQFNKFLHVPPEITKPGTSCYDVIRYQALRGDFGPTDDIEKAVQERAADDAHARRLTLRAADPQRPLHRVHLQAARRRQPARRLSRHHRAEGARAAQQADAATPAEMALAEPSASAPRRKPPTSRSRPSLPP